MRIIKAQITLTTRSNAVGSASIEALGGSIPKSGTFIYQLSVTGERMNTDYWLTA